MDTSRNDLLGELAADAALERNDFLDSAAAQVSRFLDSNESRIRELGGLTLIDDEADYLAIAEDMTFRSRNRFRDDSTGKWVSELETIDTVAELVELYNPADIFAAFAEATRLEPGARSGEGAAEEAAEAEELGASPYADAADNWAAGNEFEEAPETEEEAAERLYDLALAFQERSQQTEAHLLEQFETAAAPLTSVLGDLIVVEDEDERLTLRSTGAFQAEVIPEDEAARGEWRKLDSSDDIVEFYDPTDIFGDLADALAEAFPDLAGEAPDGEEEYEGEEDEAEGGAEGEEEAPASAGDETNGKVDSGDGGDGESR